MPIYEYECECGARFESLEAMGSVRSTCGEDCRRPASRPAPARGEGKIQRLLSAAGLRGTGHEAKPRVFDPVARANRPGCEDCDPGVAASEADV
ncbi:MAG TPA: hypothetical protein PKI03_03990 [Pseudomonadota bacterium]|jgi:predicted nucleic acid-binding Zn ribbon protein|nr:hypothetical protein [Pseudomonadota bacterium]